VLRALGLIRGNAPRRQRMVAWLEHFDACLQAAGWPGIAPGHPLAERARRNWNALCERLYRLDAVTPAGSRGAALARLRTALGETPQRRPTPTANVFIVGLGEAAVLDPTHLWLLGCEGEALHGATRPSPLLALDAQRAAGVPGADPARDLWRARVLVETLAGRGTAHHASFAAGDGEQRLTPSPLLPALASAAIAPPALYVPRAWRQIPAVQDSIADGAGPVVSPADELTGGVGALAAQSACPFRAFARYRLDARVVEEPRPGLSARVKGTAVHRGLAALWRAFGDSATLHAQSAAAIDQAIEQAVRQALASVPAATALEHEVAVVERARLASLIGQWIEFEQTRDGFTVIACEQDYTTTWGGLAFKVRPDRIDRLADGAVVVIDYKTGRCAPADWEVPRMNEPQLPFYALTAPQAPVDAIAYAQVVAGQPRWLQRPADACAAEEWAGNCTAWRDDLERLAAGLAAGAAAPQPKRGAATCRVCEQALFCRLVERAGDDDDEADTAYSSEAQDAGAGGRQHGGD
ncbi:MAG: PD-(D/E)XK nuclease family protein, partial [Gammaproteobacteria bacterium]